MIEWRWTRKVMIFTIRNYQQLFATVIIISSGWNVNVMVWTFELILSILFPLLNITKIYSFTTILFLYINYVHSATSPCTSTNLVIRNRQKMQMGLNLSHSSSYGNQKTQQAEEELRQDGLRCQLRSVLSSFQVNAKRRFAQYQSHRNGSYNPAYKIDPIHKWGESNM